MDSELQYAIDTANDLFKTRDSPKFWADNIIEASQHIKKKKNWTKFYAYMANPTAFNPSDDLKTLEDSMEVCDLSYPDYMEEVRYQNGPSDTVIHVKLRENTTVDDEKTQPESDSISV